MSQTAATSIPLVQPVYEGESQEGLTSRTIILFQTIPNYAVTFPIRLAAANIVACTSLYQSSDSRGTVQAALQLPVTYRSYTGYT